MDYKSLRTMRVVALSIMAMAAKGFDSLGLVHGESSTPQFPHRKRTQRHKVGVPNGKWVMKAHRGRV